MTEDHDDFAFEPIRGLPAALPEGERLLWQGAPSWMGLAVSAFHIRKVAIYFALVAAWQLSSVQADRMAAIAWTATAAVISISILVGLAWLYARSTVYTLTTRRIVVRSGLALPVTVNLPLALIETASLRRHGRRSGSIALEIAKPNRVAYLVLWPNVRPWTLNNPQPMLRALADAEVVIPMLADALSRTGPGVATVPAQPATASHGPGIAAGVPA